MARLGPISGETSAAIRQLIAEYVAGMEDDVAHAATRRVEALPVYSDVGGSLLLAPNGDILCLPTDSHGPPTLERDPQWQLVARVKAAEKYPQLKALLPIRDDQSVQCHSCNGSGAVSVGGVSLTCGKCRGLGWRLDV